MSINRKLLILESLTVTVLAAILLIKAVQLIPKAWKEYQNT